MPLISITAPGDIVGAITAGFNCLGELAKAVTAVAQDQSPEGRTAAKGLNEAFAIPVAILGKLNQKLGIEPAP